MNTLIETLEQEAVAEARDRLPAFRPGDTVRVDVKVVEGSTERIQAFEGLVIGMRRAGARTSFTVRKISHGEGVERVFPLYSPRIANIAVLRRGIVRRAKLYYMRGRTGKAARIRERRPIRAPKNTAKATNSQKS